MLKRKLTMVHLCKKYGDDIWGDLSRTKKIHKIKFGIKFNFFLRKGKGRKRRLDNTKALRIDVKDPKVHVKRKTAFGKIFNMKQKFKFFYGIFKDYQFKNLYLKTVYKQVKRFKYQSLIGLYESRLDIILYRANFIKSPMECRQWIHNGYVFVNGEVVTICNIYLSKSDIISVSFYLISKIRSNLLKKISIKTIGYFNIRHLEICFRRFRIVFINRPLFTEVFFPFRVIYSKLFNVYDHR
jgi:ribosomal protein S4